MGQQGSHGNWNEGCAYRTYGGEYAWVGWREPSFGFSIKAKSRILHEIEWQLDEQWGPEKKCKLEKEGHIQKGEPRETSSFGIFKFILIELIPFASVEGLDSTRLQSPYHPYNSHQW